MEAKLIVKEADDALGELIQLVSKFTDEQINIVPFANSWTPGQLAGHMIMANSGFVEMITGPVKDTKRKPDEVAPSIKADFLNFDIKMTSPDFIVPPFKKYDKAELLGGLNQIKEAINSKVAALDLTKICVLFEVPFYGFLTRLEALYFITYHTQRHIRQLKNIYQKINYKQAV